MSLPARTPTTPPPAAAPSAPNTSSVASVSTLPLVPAPSVTLLVFGNAVGTSSMMLMVTAEVSLLPSSSVTVTLTDSMKPSPVAPAWLSLSTVVSNV